MLGIFTISDAFILLQQCQLSPNMNTNPLDSFSPEIDAFFSDRFARKKPATLLDSARQPLAKGEVRQGTESDPGEVFYPRIPQVLPDETIALASWIETEDEVFRISGLNHCWNGSVVHCHFVRAAVC